MDTPVTSAPQRRTSALRPELLIGVVVVLLIGAVLGFFAWKQSQEEPVSIAEVLGDLRKYDGLSVTLKGRVAAPTNLFGIKYFELDDGTGSVKVVTERGLPAEGSEITVSGIVKQAMQVGDMELTVILEPAMGDEGD
jgi:hypothetical protein